jgi:peptidoglycan/xylan/chitin deacetylase (PgdA/CDA1 family)
MYNYIYKGTALPSLPVWLTFDDSYQNIYDYAYPVMNPRGLKASIFANTQWMGQMNSWDLCCEPQHLHMTWNMLSQMAADGFAADSHTQHHVHYFDLQPNQQQAEVWGTQRDLVSFLGTPAKNFSYPYGQYPDSAEWAIAHSGFHAATIIGQAKQYTDFANMFELTRIGVADSDTLQQFINKLTAP